MRAIKTLHSAISDRLQKSHARRVDSVLFAVDCLLGGGRLSLTALGRAQASAVAPKHNIKRIDRLLGNEKLHRELPMYFGAIAGLVIGAKKRPVVLVVWTILDKQYHALVAAGFPMAEHCLLTLKCTLQRCPVIVPSSIASLRA